MRVGLFMRSLNCLQLDLLCCHSFRNLCRVQLAMIAALARLGRIPKAGSGSPSQVVSPLVTLHPRMTWSPYESHPVSLTQNSMGTLTVQDKFGDSNRSSQDSKSRWTVSAYANTLIPLGKGVRQGDTISPKLFTLAL